MCGNTVSKAALLQAIKKFSVFCCDGYLFDTLVLPYCTFCATWHVARWRTSLYYRGKRFRWVPRQHLTGSNQVRQQHAPTFHPLLFPSLPSQRGIFFNLLVPNLYSHIVVSYEVCRWLPRVSYDLCGEQGRCFKHNLFFWGKVLPTAMYATTKKKFPCPLLEFILK
jgi:hypothetical protein